MRSHFEGMYGASVPGATAYGNSITSRERLSATLLKYLVRLKGGEAVVTLSFHQQLPGTMDTPANRKDTPGADVSQWVQPASVASLIVWLAGDAGKDLTGAAIPVYGAGL
jgi:hypothetical protein